MRFGRYRLVERLGAGCQAQVWKALQVEPVVETVALKLLSPAWSHDPRRLLQFRREAEVGARLDSPWLLPTYEFGTLNGIHFLTMPLVDGRALSDVLSWSERRDSSRLLKDWTWWGVLSDDSYVRAVIRVLTRVARALHVAHTNRLVHRDVKPSNILVDRHREDRVFLSDFGLSRDLDADPAEPPSIGTGTLLYMAPEKLLGRVVDEVRCDIYALGVTLFETIARVHPFSVPDDLPSSEWVAHLALATPRNLLEVSPRVPEPLNRIVRKAMANDPGQRYPSAAALANDLERFSNRRSAS